MKFGVYLYDGVEPIDLATIGVLSMAKRIRADIAFCTIAPQAGPVRLSNGLTVLADHGLLDAPQVDVLIVTGGPGWSNKRNRRQRWRSYVAARPIPCWHPCAPAA